MSDFVPDNREVVILIHGTGAGSRDSVGSRWWQTGSGFSDHLNDRLGPAIRTTEDVFHWSGDNQESARRRSGKRLYDRMKRMEADGTRFHLVGHSHGGSVIWHALKSAAAEKNVLPNLRSWTTIGTPFLAFMPDPIVSRVFGRWFRSVIALIVCILVYVWQFDGWSGIDSSNPMVVFSSLVVNYILWAWGFGLFLLGAFVSIRVMWHLWILLKGRSERKREERACDDFIGRWCGLASSLDEAIGAIQSSTHLDAKLLARREYLGIGGAIARSVRSLINRRSEVKWLFSQLGFICRQIPIFLLPPAILTVCALPVVLSDHFPAEVGVGTMATLIFVSVGLIGVAGWLLMRIIARFVDQKLDAEARGRSFDDPVDTELTANDGKGSFVEGKGSKRRPDVDRARRSVIGMVIGDITALIYNQIVLPVMDDFVWTKITQSAQGNDQTGFIVCAASAAPIAGLVADGLPAEIEEEIVAEADEHAARSLRRIRQAITEAAFGNQSVKEAFGNEVTYRELVHNSYFHNQQFRELLFSWIEASSNGDRNELARHPSVFLSEHDARRRAADRARARTRFVAVVTLLLSGVPFIVIAPLYILFEYIM